MENKNKKNDEKEKELLMLRNKQAINNDTAPVTHLDHMNINGQRAMFG